MLDRCSENLRWEGNTLIIDVKVVKSPKRDRAPLPLFNAEKFLTGVRFGSIALTVDWQSSVVVKIVVVMPTESFRQNEVTGLRLRSTELVVLSACETGVGEVSQDSGVYGLRRAFTLAGAQTQLMSLWKVADEQTKDLMIEYYQCLENGEGRGEALRQVQLVMLGNAETKHPYFWATFIPTGDWRSLD